MIGKTISHYKILGKLGEGGMGLVYKAEDIKLKRTVALKFLPPDLTRDPVAKERFSQEAQAASSLDHNNICTIHEIDETDDRQTFIVMACYEGETLKEKIRSGPLGIEEALDITLQVARGLEKAHQQGIVHRDIKPANIFITKEGVVKIVDFGLSKLAGQSGLTKEGTVLGTVAYMSPEQTRGNEVDCRTDIWSLSVVFYEMLTGQLPFKGDYDQAIIYSIVNESPASLTSIKKQIPSELEKKVLKGLKKGTEERYQTMTEFCENMSQVTQQIVMRTSGIRPSGFILSQLIRTRWLRVAIPFIAIFLLLMIMFLQPTMRSFFSRWLGFGNVPREKHLAILPFHVIGGDDVSKAFCDGLVETITSTLTQLEQYKSSLWIVPASEVRGFGIISIKEARRAFGVNMVINGSMQNVDEMVHLTLNLIDAKTLRQIESQILIDNKSNIAILHDRAIAELTEMMDLELQPQIRQVLTAQSTVAPGSYEFYLQGRGYLQRYEKLENVDNAMLLFSKAIQLDSSFALAYAGMGEACWLKYDLTKDIYWTKQAESNCKTAIRLNDRLIPVRLTLGIIYKGIGRYEEAIGEFKRCLQVDPVNYNALRESGIVYEELDKLPEAEATYREAIRLKPGYWAGYNCLGHFYWRFGELLKAEEMFRQVMRLTPDNVRGYNNLMGIYFSLEQYELSRMMFEKSIAIEPNADAYSNMGTFEFFLGRYQSAVALFEEAAGIGHNDYRIWGNLADAYRYVPEYSERIVPTYQRAIQLAQEQLSVNPKDSHLLKSLALYHARLGENERAMIEITKAQNLSSQDITILRTLVIILELTGQRDRSFNALEKYIERGGSLGEIENDPDLMDLRNDHRYQQIVPIRVQKEEKEFQ